MNPTALVFWALLTGVGYLFSGWHGALVGLLIGLAVSFLADHDVIGLQDHNHASFDSLGLWRLPRREWLHSAR